MQLKLKDYYDYSSNGELRNETILEAVGDALMDKSDDHMRFLLHNINGMKLRDGFDVAPEIAVIGAYQADVAGYTEINTNATTRVQDTIRNQMQSHLGTSQVSIASGKATKDGYLPGGVMLASVGHHNGRIRQRGSDKWGRFTWFCMRGS